MGAHSTNNCAHPTNNGGDFIAPAAHLHRQSRPTRLPIPRSLVPLFPRSLAPSFPRSLVPLFPCSLGPSVPDPLTRPPKKLFPPLAGNFALFVIIETIKPQKCRLSSETGSRSLTLIAGHRELPRGTENCELRTGQLRTPRGANPWGIHGRLQKKKTGKTGESPEVEIRNSFVLSFLRIKI
jgi:hypothetical protein